MTEELKVFESPIGKLKGTLKLGQKVFKTDTEMRKHITSEDMAKIGTELKLPVYTNPFAIFTEKECMLLWASSEKDRDRWVEGFE